MNENWSIKLQVGGGGVPLYNEWELVYKSAQTGYKLTQGKASITGQMPGVVTHQSDSSAAVLARAIEQNKTLAFEISILDNVNAAASFDWDVALNNVHTLARHLSGATSTAVRSASGGQNVRIAIKPDTATYTTYYDVQWGSVDTSASYYLAESQQGSTQVGTKGAWWIPVTLTLKDGGYGDAFTLRNDLPSSPHMIEDSNADGLADGLTLVGAPTATIATNRYLVGGKSQKLTTDNASNQGIQTDVVTATAGTAVVGYVDLNLDGDRVSVILRDDVGVIQTKLITENNTPATASRSFVDPFGAVFYRIEVSGVTTALSTNCYIQVRRVIGDATQATQIWIDKIYLQTGTATVPAGFCSSSNLKNRNDPASTTAATRQQINYLDVWGVPGDLPADYKIITAAAPGTHKAWYINTRPLTQYSPNVYRHWLDDSDVTSTTAARGGWSNSAAATFTEGTAKLFTSTSANGVGALYYEFIGSEARRLFQFPFFVYPLMTASAQSVAIEIEIVGYGLSLFKITKTLVVSNSSINITEGGLVNLTGLFPELDDVPDTTQPDALDDLTLILTINTVTSGDTVTVDAIVLFHQVSNSIVVQFDNVTTYIGNILWMNSKTNRIISSTTATQLAPIHGTFEKIIPFVENRMIFLRSDSGVAVGAVQTALYTLTNTIPIELTITPRTSHLLGTA